MALSSEQLQLLLAAGKGASLAAQPQFADLGGGYRMRVDPSIGQILSGAGGAITTAKLGQLQDEQKRKARLADLEDELTLRGLAKRQYEEAMYPIKQQREEAKLSRLRQDSLREQMRKGGFSNLVEMDAELQRRRELKTRGLELGLENMESQMESRAVRDEAYKERQARIAAETVSSQQERVKRDAERAQKRAREAKLEELLKVRSLIDDMQNTLREPDPLDYAKFYNAHPNANITKSEYDAARRSGKTDEQILQELGQASAGAPVQRQSLDSFFE